MSGQWRETLATHWRTFAFVAFGLAVAAVGFIFGGPVAGATVLLTVVGGVVSSQSSKGTPKPRLALVLTRQIELHPSRAVAAIFAQVSGEEPPVSEPSETKTGWLLFGARRELDLDAIREDAISRAHAAAPRDGMLETLLLGTMGQFAKPTKEDRQEFALKVEEYGEQLGGWLEEIKEPVEAEMAVLVAQVELRNEAKLDAGEARVVLRFPKGFAAAGDAEEVEEAPPVPKLPLRRAGLGLMDPGSNLAPRYPAPRPIAAHTHPPFALPPMSMEEPDYNKDGEDLVVSYPRQTVRHGETASAGDELRVRATGDQVYEVAWEIHASNLKRAARGTVQVRRSYEIGEPVRTLAELEHLLVELGLAEPDEE